MKSKNCSIFVKTNLPKTKTMKTILTIILTIFTLCVNANYVMKDSTTLKINVTNDQEYTNPK